LERLPKLKLDGLVKMEESSMKTERLPLVKKPWLSETISILHFNDVYNIEARKKDPCGGIERFVTVLDKYKDKDPLVLFSGDIFSPSSLSITFKGEHMMGFL
jgi:5'-nucleotidase